MLLIPYRTLHSPRRPCWMTWLLVAANILLFVQLLRMDEAARVQSLYRYGAVPSLLFSIHSTFPFVPFDRLPSLVTSMFLHGSLLHLLGNMLFLWVFGMEVEERMGAFRFLLFYLFCGFVGSLAYCLLHLGSQQVLIGASGAIAGVLGAYLWQYPMRPIQTIVVIIIIGFRATLPAFVVLGYWLLLQLANSYLQVLSLLPKEQESVAWLAHVGGFFAGVAWVVGRKRRRR